MTSTTGLVFVPESNFVCKPSHDWREIAISLFIYPCPG